MPSALLNLFRHPREPERHLHILFYLVEFLIDPVKLCPPVDRVEPRLDDLVFSWLLVGRFLLAIDIRVKEVDFGFFHLAAL
jgi:hypothetical protein